MVRTRCIITGTFRSIGTQENRTGIHHLFGQFHIIGSFDNQVFRSVFIGHRNCLFHILHQNQLTVCQGLFGHFPTRQTSQLTLHFVFHFIEQLFRSSNQNYLTIHPVFSLRKQIGSHKSRIGSFIGNNFYFRRSGRHIDCYIVQRNLLLGSHDILIARSENLIYLRYTFRSVSHGTNGLYTTCLKNLAYTRNLSRIENSRMNFAFLVRRST